MATVLQSCGGIYYATSSIKNDQLIVKKSEFWEIVKEKKKNRTFVMLNVLSLYLEMLAASFAGILNNTSPLPGEISGEL